MNAYLLSRSNSSISAYTEKLEQLGYVLMDIDNDFGKLYYDEGDILRNVNVLEIPEEKYGSVYLEV